MSRRDVDSGVLDAVRRIAATVTALAADRFELASLELGEVRNRLLQAIAAAIVAALLVVGVVASLSAWLAVALWDRLGHGVLGLLALAYAVAAALLVLWLRSRLRSAPPPLAHTLQELRQDARALSGESPPTPNL